ncbi:putative membrane protein/domain protein [Mycolicibacterium chubuense NBB4]|uniref:Putative membrane protein/domain protein n=1 Tax=Mycolicibacterium chubuense (strain NBB4) TaxID=710421 RepID=I4BCE9_MYCCN|nr:RDD family protein [Mycolicibacterium chubuense]AFM14956.1 putative membrane protein/domain protein [Mycolicibacterium chubuense NBB4]
MTAVLDTGGATGATATPDQSTPDVALASWPSRAGALVVDVLPGLGVVATCALLALAAPADGAMRWVFTVLLAVTLAAMVLNRVLLPSVIGWTLGRALFGIAVARRTGEPAGLLRLTARELAHVLDTLAVFVGWLWPLWDRRRRTFADLLARTEVRRVPGPERNVRRLVAAVLVGLAVLCAAAAALGYVTSYRHERAVEQANAQIKEQGPRIVEQMLSYGVDTMAQDFAKAQTLTTDGYRPQLVAQQQTVQRAGATTNEYWAVSSAVLPNPPVTPDQASMLLALQGQRGTDPKSLKFITATVRVDFRKIDGQWRVANLTVLKQPQMQPAAGQ